MMNKTVGVVSFLLGVVAGSLVTYQAIKEKYEKIAQSEIDSVKKSFSDLYDKRLQNDSADNKPDETKQEYEQILKDKEYVNYSDMSEPANEQEKPVKSGDRPYLISSDQFGELDDYEAITLIYYADGVLADDNMDVVDDVDDIVGLDSLTRFAEYESDAIYVRNDKHKCDYEICRDEESYSDIVRDSPY